LLRQIKKGQTMRTHYCGELNKDNIDQTV